MDYQSFKNAVIAQAEALGIKDYELYYESGSDTSVSAFMHEINDFSSSEGGGVCFRCIVGGKMGYASTQALSEAEAAAIVKQATDNAAVLEADEEVFLCEGGKEYEPLDVTPYALPTVEDICAKATRIVVLESIMNPTNVGAIFRSAAALGMDAVLLTPGCTNPLYRRSARVSMGTVFQIPWTFISEDMETWPHPGMDQLRALGFKTVAMALTDNSISIDDPRLAAEEKLAIVLGTEGDGLADTTIADCDYTVRIPMSHGVDSLNVAAASAVAFWQLGNH